MFHNPEIKFGHYLLTPLTYNLSIFIYTNTPVLKLFTVQESVNKVSR